MTKFNDAEITWENSHEKARSDTADMGEARDNLIDLYITADDVWDAVCALNYDAEVDEKQEYGVEQEEPGQKKKPPE